MAVGKIVDGAENRAEDDLERWRLGVISVTVKMVFGHVLPYSSADHFAPAEQLSEPSA